MILDCDICTMYIVRVAPRGVEILKGPLFRLALMENVRLNALKTTTALMVTIVTNAAGKQDINKKTS